MPLHVSIAKKLRKGYPVVVEGKEYFPLRHKKNPHQKKYLEHGITHLKVGHWVICRLGGFLEDRMIQDIQQQNYLPRFRVNVDGDIKQWIGKTKILGVEKLEEEISIERI